MIYQTEILDYLNQLSYLKKGHIKVLQVAKDTDFSMYQCNEVLEDLYQEGKLQKRYEIIDIETALNYGCFKTIKDIPKIYTSDDGVVLDNSNRKVKVFYRYKDAHSFI